MYHNYIDLAERLNEQLPNEEGRYAKIYVWTDTTDNAKHGVEAVINGVKHDIAVNCKRSELISMVVLAFHFITRKLGLDIEPQTIKLSNEQQFYI
jgi:hypothetical protein